MTHAAGSSARTGRRIDMQWWLDGKFGLFIHWGPSSVAGVEIS
ncbi:MAG: alpha-L-fucosidase, partial [Planctomycetota bacterium]